MDGEAQREFTAMAAKKCGGMCVVFSGDDQNGYQYVAVGGDLALFGRQLKDALAARGGGSVERIQGHVSVTSAEIECFWHMFCGE